MKKRIFRLGLIVALCCFALNVQATGNGLKENMDTNEENNNRVFECTEEPPYFKGGQKGLNRWLSGHLRYPEEALKYGVEGQVVVQFTIEKDGSVDYVEVLKSASPELDAEVMRVVKLMPKWSPLKWNRVPHRAKLVLPITFKKPDYKKR